MKNWIHIDFRPEIHKKKASFRRFQSNSLRQIECLYVLLHTTLPDFALQCLFRIYHCRNIFLFITYFTCRKISFKVSVKKYFLASFIETLSSTWVCWTKVPKHALWCQKCEVVRTWYLPKFLVYYHLDNFNYVLTQSVESTRRVERERYEPVCGHTSRFLT